MSRFKLFLFLILVFAPVMPSAEEPPFLTRITEDFKYTLSSPARIDKEDLLCVAGISSLGAVLIWQDNQINKIIQRNRTDNLDSIFSRTNYLGDGAYNLGFLGLLGTTGYLINDEKLKKTTMIGLETFIVSAAITNIIKVSLGRARPYEDKNSNYFKPFSFKEGYNSFPSGHTTSAFAIATVIATEYETNKFIPLAAYSLASVAGLSRIYEEAHWSSDVFAGTLIGYGTGKAIRYLHTKKYPLKILPVIGFNNKDYGLTLATNF